PTPRLKGLAIQHHDPPRLREQVPLIGQRFRQVYRAAIAPERRILPLRGGVMQNEKIAHALVFEGGQAIVFGADDRIEIAVGKVREQSGEACLNEMNAGRLERLEEAGRQSERQTVADPYPIAAPRLEAQEPGSRALRAFEARGKSRAGLVVGKMRARINVAVANSMLQRDPPLPAAWA